MNILMNLIEPIPFDRQLEGGFWKEPIQEICEYPDNEKVKSVIDKWKKTAFEREFTFHAISTLSCEVSEKGPVLTFATHKDPHNKTFESFLCTIDKIKAQGHLKDKDPSLYDLVRIKIKGKNLESGERFKIEIGEIRSPKATQDVIYQTKFTTKEIKAPMKISKNSFKPIRLWKLDSDGLPHSNYWEEPIKKICEHPDNEEVKKIIDKWKEKVLERGFTFHALSNLSCEVSEKGPVLTFATHKDPHNAEFKSIFCDINKIILQGESDTKDAEEPCLYDLVRIKIEGKNVETGNDFKMVIEEIRSPEETQNVSYSEKIPTY